MFVISLIHLLSIHGCYVMNGFSGIYGACVFIVKIFNMAVLILFSHKTCVNHHIHQTPTDIFLSLLATIGKQV